MTDRFGPYRLVRRLATGGMAEVFLAVQTGIEGFEREVVIKRILPHRAQDAEFCTMFLDEARLIARLSHPNIAQIYDLGRVEESFYIAMEYVRGLDLAGLLDLAARGQEAGLPDVVAIPVVTALCEALHYIHTRADEFGSPLNIVHRDLNPKNVIVSYDGAVKLIDFGIAKAASQVYETRTGVIKGTYGYMAPEQVTKRRPIDSRADLFALGVLAYELTTGRHPFDAPDEVAVLSKLVRGTFVPPSKAVTDYPKELERIVLALMQLEPDARPASAREVLTRVERFALNQRLPLTMARVADYVRLQAAPEEGVDRVSATVDKAGESTALVSQRLAKRADHETAELATAYLKTGRSTEAVGPAPPIPPAPPARRPSRAGAAEAPRRAAAPSRGGREWPWSSWGARERIVGLVAAAAVGLAAVVATVLVLAPLVLRPDGGARGPAATGRPANGRGDKVPPMGTSLDPAGPAGPAVGDNFIDVESEPSGAEILVEGRATGRLTPNVVPVPPGQRFVWIGVRRDGYRPEERQVETSAGAAVFTLRPEAGAEDYPPGEPE